MQHIESSKAAGVDKISGRLLKDLANILTKTSLCTLWSINLQNQSQAYIFKKTKKTDLSSYRPIPLLPGVSKDGLALKDLYDTTCMILLIWLCKIANSYKRDVQIFVWCNFFQLVLRK